MSVGTYVLQMNWGSYSIIWNALANFLSVMQSPSREPVRLADPISNLDAFLLAFLKPQVLRNPLYREYTSSGGFMARSARDWVSSF